MATEVPRRVTLEVPPWFWNGQVAEYLSAARLKVISIDETRTRVVVEAQERSSSERPKLVSYRDLTGSGGSEDFALLKNLETRAREEVRSVRDREVGEIVDALVERAEQVGGLTGITAAFASYQLQVMTIATEHLAEVVKAVWESIKEIPFDSDPPSFAFPHASVHIVMRDHALLQRSKLAAVLLRTQHDPNLRSANLAPAIQANASGELVFDSSGALGDGVALLDAYLAPLLAAITPFVWAFPAVRASGTIVFAFGSRLSGTEPFAVEPLHLLPARGPDSAAEAPPLREGSASAAVQWWTRRLDKVMSVITDPAVFADERGVYAPNKHLHAQLSLDQLFRRVSSLQRAHRDTDARRVLLFTVLDTLNRLTNRTIVEMATLSSATRVLSKVSETMSRDSKALLLPGAERAVEALRAVQDGFFIARQTGSGVVAFIDSDGLEQTLDLETATAQYILVLRNATHGHGSNIAQHRPRTDALLAHHDGRLPHDLGLLGWLYLLEILADPSRLRRNLYQGGRA